MSANAKLSHSRVTRAENVFDELELETNFLLSLSWQLAREAIIIRQCFALYATNIQLKMIVEKEILLTH